MARATARRVGLILGAVVLAASGWAAVVVLARRPDALPAPAGRGSASLAPTSTATADPPSPPPPATTSTERRPGPRPAPAPAADPPAAVAPPELRIRIPAIGVSAPVDPMGLNADGTLEVPRDFARAGYYAGRAVPGEIGPAIVEGHVDSKRGSAVFYRLKDLRPGDQVIFDRVDGGPVTFVVDHLEQHGKNAFPTEAVYGPTPDATLRLVTCAGGFNHAIGHYRDNLIVFAHREG